MADLPNQYVVPSLPNLDPQANRVIQDLAARVNYLTTELDKVRGLTMSASPGVDAAQRAYPVGGMINLPGQRAPAFITVTSHGVISSYASPNNISSNGQIVGVPYTILNSNAQAGNSGAGLTALHSLTLEANSMANDGDFIEIVQNGTYANNTVTKRITTTFGPVTIEDTGLIDVRGGLCWQCYTVITRVSPVLAHIIFSGWLQFVQADSASVVAGGFGGRFITRGAASATVNHLNTSTNVVSVSGQATNNNDITQTFTAVKLTRMS